MPICHHNRAPNYDWTCYKCKKDNCAGVNRCAHCDFPANFRMSEIPYVPAPVTDKHLSQADNVAHNIWMFMPEGIIATALAMYTPFWAVQQFAQGYVAAPLVLLVGEAMCVWLFVQACITANKWLACGAMAIFMLMFFVITPTVK